MGSDPCESTVMTEDKTRRAEDPVWQRRQALRTETNPHRRLDYVVTLDGAVRLPPVAAEDTDDDGRIVIRYVPDRLVLVPAGFWAYVAGLAPGPWPVLEALAAVVMEDLNNELVPRWLRVDLRREGSPAHHVSLEDRQPRWQTPEILSRLRPDSGT